MQQPKFKFGDKMLVELKGKTDSGLEIKEIKELYIKSIAYSVGKGYIYGLGAILSPGIQKEVNEEYFELLVEQAELLPK